MSKTNWPTIIAVVIALALAGVLIAYGLRDGGDGSREQGSTSFEVVTRLPPPVEFQLAEVPAGPRLDLSATLLASDGEEVALADMVRGRALVMLLDGDTRSRYTKDATRALRALVDGGSELHFPVVVVLPRGHGAADAEEFAVKRRLEVPVFVDRDGDFASANDWAANRAALVAGDGTIMREFLPVDTWDERFGTLPPVNDDVLFWAWRIPAEGPSIDREGKDAAVSLVRAALGTTMPDQGLPEELERLAADPALAFTPEHEVYVSLFRPGRTTGLRGVGTRGTFGERLVAATADALHGQRDAPEWIAAAPEVRFLIDVLGPDFPIPGRELRTLWYFVEPGVDGLRVVNGEKAGVVLPGEVVTRGIMSPRVRGRDDKLERLLPEACRRAGMASKAWSQPETDLRRFRTTCFGEVVPGAGAVDVYRGNVLLGERQTSEEILRFIVLGGRWLLNTVKDDGTFDYEYYPNTDQHSKDYSWVRHAGSVYGLFEMYELAYDEPAMQDDLQDYMEAGVKAVGGVYDALGVIPGTEEMEGGPRWCLLEGTRCQSGSAALSLMTYLSRPPVEHIRDASDVAALYREDDRVRMDGLARAMLDMIDDDGKVFRSYAESRSKDAVDKEPLYFPGEVMLALTRYYIATEDERWLEGAERIARRQCKAYRKDRWDNPDHWVMQALYLLFHTTGEQEYADTALRMGTHHASEQFSGPLPPPFPDYRGAYRRASDVPRTTRAGSRTEAMMAVVRTAWEMGVDARIYEDAVLAATRHMSEQIYRPENTFWMANPASAMGALRMGIVDNHCRIDNNQHALVGMAGALEVARKREALAETTEP